MISKRSIQDILEKISIIELISEYTELKRAGRNFSGLCPFHEENTPSFYVDEDKKLFHCFGCKKGGNLIQFIQEKEALNFVEALEYLSDKFNIALEYENGKGRQDRFGEYYNALGKVNNIFISNLWSDRNAVKYLKERGISKALYERFNAGFSNGNLIDSLKKQDISIDILVNSGIISRTSEGLRENFRDRITFPVKDKYGKVRGFVGRTVTGNRFKYLNSQNSEIYDKSKLMFGFSLARNVIRDKDFSIVCEGTFDCIRLFEAGFENSVSVLGTKMSTWQIKELSRLSKNIFIMFDGDQAGRDASLELCRKAAETDSNMRICILPEKSDPDTFISEKGMQGVVEVLKSAVFYVDYFLDSFMQDTNDMYRKSGNFNIVSDFLNSIANYYIRNKYLARIEQFFGMGIKLEKKETEKSETDKIEEKDRDIEISRYYKDLLNLAITYDKVLDIIFKKYYKTIDDLNFKNIILNLHLGKKPAEILCLDIPETYKKMMLQYEFIPEKKLVLTDPEAEVVHIFNLLKREHLLEEIKICEKHINNPKNSEDYVMFQNRYIELIRNLQNIE